MNKKRNDPKVYNKFIEPNCVACGHNGSFYKLTIDHVKTRGSGGKDEKENCMTLCLSCHKEKGQITISEMANKYPNYKKWLTTNGWSYCDFRQKWIR